MECNYLTFWRLVVILIVEGAPPPSDRSKGETGSCCKSMHFSLFLRLSVCAEQRDVALLFSCRHPVAWWYLRRHRLARLLAILQLPVVASGALPLPLPF